MIPSGSTGTVTVGNAAVIVIALTGIVSGLKNIHVTNEGTAPGFLSVNGGVDWIRIAGGTATQPFLLTLYGIQFSGSVQIKRVAGGTDMSGIWINVW